MKIPRRRQDAHVARVANFLRGIVEVFAAVVVERFDQRGSRRHGGFAAEPWIELTIPSLADPTWAVTGSHVVSAYVQYAPYHLRGTTWDAERDHLSDIATRVVERYAPGFTSSIVARVDARGKHAGGGEGLEHTDFPKWILGANSMERCNGLRTGE